MNASLCINAQVTSPFSEQFKASDTNGLMGECLFPISDAGNVLYQGVMESNFSKSELKEEAEADF